MNNKETTRNMLNNTTRKFQSFSEFLNEERQKKLQKKIQKRFLIESEEVLSEFEKEFPKEIVRADPKERPLEVTEENMRKIFRILNKMFFEGKLKEIPLIGETVWNAVPILSKLMNRRVNVHKLEGMLGFNRSKIEPNDSTKSCDVVPDTEFIYIQLIDDRKTSFGYFVATLLHEMIHNYDEHFGDLPKHQYKSICEKTSHNEHETIIFKGYMKMANDNGILVKAIANDTYENLNKEAQEFFLRMSTEKTENESEEIPEIVSKTQILVKNDDGTYDAILFQ